MGLLEARFRAAWLPLNRQQNRNPTTMKTLLVLCILAFAAPAALAGHCAPHVTHTCVISRSTQCRWATDSCGHRFRYEVTVMVYRHYLSDGTSRTVRRTVRL
jgi:hypothetical protein